ncbi:MAG: ketopantoate reductase family protein [Gammaproteobacteria bacterium]
MKICVFGAGAVGAHVAARLIDTGDAQVSVVARGAHLAAIRERGIRLRSGGREILARPDAATDDAGTLPPQDLVLVGLKAPALGPSAEAIARLLAPGAAAVFMTNGVPWWWWHGAHGAQALRPPQPLPLLDPDARLWNRVTPARAIGCVLYSGNEITEPGTVQHTTANEWYFSEPDGMRTDRLTACVALFRAAGFEARVPEDFRTELWRKLLANAGGNTLGALTRYSAQSLALDPDTRELRTRVIAEMLEIGAALGCDLRAALDPARMATMGANMPGVRPSMLQDVLAGRPNEVEAIVGQPLAFARELGVSAPALETIVPLLRALDRSVTGRAPAH